MIGTRHLLLVAACLLHGVIPFARSEPPAPRKPAVRVDAFGAPLPAGALVRLGTSRFRGLGGPIQLSSDGKRVVLVDAGGIRLLDTSTGRELRRVACKDFEPDVAAISADGKLVATGERSRLKVRLWNLDTGQERILSDSGLVTAFVFSANGKVLAAWRDAHVKAWETASGKALGPFKVLQTQDVQGALSPDGKTLLTFNGREEDRPLKVSQLWDTATGKERGRVTVDGASAASFSPDGKVLAVTSWHGIVLWDLAANKERGRLFGRWGIGHVLAFSPDGKTLVGASRDGAMQWWDVATGRRRGLRPGRKGVELCSVACLADGRILVCASEGQVLHLWEATTRRSLSPTEGHRQQILLVVFSPDGKRITTAAADQTLCTWDAATGKLFVCRDLSDRISNVPRLSYDPLSIAVSPDGKFAAVGMNLHLRLLEVAGAEEVCRIDLDAVGSPRLAFSPDGAFLVVGKRLVDVETGKTVRWLWGSTGGQVAISRDGKWLAVTAGAEVYVEHLTTGKEICHVEMPPRQVDSYLSFSPDGLFFAYGCSLFDAATGKKIREWKLGDEMDSGITAAPMFAPDGRTVAIGMYDRIRLAEVLTGEVRYDITGYPGWVTALTYSADGNVLAAGNFDTTTLLWDVKRLPLDGPPLKERLTAGDLQVLWDKLPRMSAREAYRVIRQLVAVPQETLPFLEKHLRPVPSEPADARRIQELLAALDARSFSRREQAKRELAAMGKMAEPALRKTFRDRPTLEVRRRLQDLLALLEQSVRGPLVVRRVRAVEVLELIGNERARRLLASLARGHASEEITREAQAALQRLTREPPRH